MATAYVQRRNAAIRKLSKQFKAGRLHNPAGGNFKSWKAARKFVFKKSAEIAGKKQRASGSGKKHKSKKKTSKKKSGKARRTPAQRAATRKMIAANKRQARGSGQYGSGRGSHGSGKKPKSPKKGGARRHRKAFYNIGGKRLARRLTPNQARELAHRRGMKARRAKNQKPAGSGQYGSGRRKGGGGLVLGILAGVTALGVAAGVAARPKL